MLTYRRIENEKTWLRVIYAREQEMPRWWKDAAAVWTPTFEKFEKFWADCREIYGLFDQPLAYIDKGQREELMAVVYFEYLQPDVVNVHISVIGRVPLPELVRFFCSLKATKRAQGIRTFTGWILERHRVLGEIAERTGFVPTGLKMDYGASRGRILRWLQVASN